MSADRDIPAGRIRRLAARFEPHGNSDAALLGRFVADRDEAAFAALVDRYGRLVLHVCRRTLGDAHDAQDAFQATFMVLARRAAVVQPREALAAWLHGVARRVAFKARRALVRRRREAGQVHGEVAEARPDPLDDLSARELLALIDDEVGRLPEVYRLPVILCCLEGLTQDEAARQLGWTPGSVKGRLERGRERLSARLARRGLAPAVLAAAELSRGASSAAAQWAAPTVAAALAFAAGRAAGCGVAERAAALAGGVARGMALARLKVPTALVLAGCLLAAGFAAYRAPDPPHQAGTSSPPTANSNRVAPAARDEAAGPWPEEANHPIRVGGHVLDPAGRPFAGARLYVAYAPRRCDYANSHPVAFPVRGTSAADGRFDFTFARSELDERYLDVARPVVVATADGFGMAWAEIDEPAALSLRLVEDVPIEGRVLDRARAPVAGAKVSVRELSADLAAGLEHYAKFADRSAFRNCRGPLPGVPPEVTTGPDGRFRLTGLGRDRLVTLAFEGAAIAPADLTVATTATPLPLRTPGPTFDFVAHPARLVRGTVRDKATGRPVAGVRITLDQLGPEATTDADGRYELRCHRMSYYSVTARPPGGEPYFAAGLRLTEKPGAEPLTADFDLAGGTPLRGRVADRSTGRPPRRAVVAYYALASNPHAAALTNPAQVAPSYAPVRPDGSYTLTILPGPGAVVVFASPRDFYASAALDARELAGLAGGAADPDGGPCILVAAGAVRDRRPVQRHHAVALIGPDEKTEALAVDLEVQPARRVRGAVVGPDGRPLTGVRVTGLTSAGDPEVLHDPSFTVEGLNPQAPRELSFQHPAKGLAAIATVRGDETGPVTVRLEPLATVSGRLVDGAGKPVARVPVAFHRKVGGLPVRVVTDQDGRFRVSLVAGQEYSLSSARRLAAAVAPVAAEAGRDKELGDLRVGD